MSLQNSTPFLAAFILIYLSSISAAQIVRYEEDFESPVTLSSQIVGPGLSVEIDNIEKNPGGWRIHGGTSGNGTVALNAGIDSQGVGGSQSLFANWNNTGAAASNFLFNQYEIFTLPGFPVGTAEANVRVALDIFMSGSESSNSPITVVFAGNNGNINRPFFPQLANNQFSHVEFSLDQTSGSAVDLTQSFNLRLLNNGTGFGFDANNIVRIDNVSVYAIPEPTALVAAATGLVAIVGTARRKKLSLQV